MGAGTNPGRAVRGFTLIELLISLTVVALVLGAVFFTFFRAQANAQRMNALIESRQNARAACQLIERETRMAGSGWGRKEVNVYQSGSTFLLTPVDAGYDPSRSDTLGLVGAFAGTSTTLASAMTSPTSSMLVQSIAGFSDSDLVVVTDGSTAHMFRVTGLQTGPDQLLHAPSSPWNPSGSFTNWPLGGYGIGSDVYKATWVQYRFDSTGFSRPSLVRIEDGGAPQVVAQTVKAFYVYYLMQDGTVTRSPSSWTMVDKVRPVVKVSYTDANHQTVTDSVWAIAKPRTY